MQIRENEPLSKHSTWRVGGPAKFFVEAVSSDTVIEAIEWARSEKIKFVVIGGGTNILPADSGYDGLIIKVTNRQIRVEGDRVIATAGAITSMVARAAAEASLTGLEWAVTIPGTIGGAVVGNAGCFGGEMSQVVEEVQVVRHVARGGQLAVLKNSELDFSYRHSALKGSDITLLEVTMKLKPGDTDQIKTTMDQWITKRKESQPLGSSCAGCVFKNPEGDSAGRLIDVTGLKGQTVGGASVSTDHANFILNDGTATADHIIQLISLIKTRVRDEFGIQLEEEVQYIGT